MARKSGVPIELDPRAHQLDGTLFEHAAVLRVGQGESERFFAIAPHHLVYLEPWMA